MRRFSGSARSFVAAATVITFIAGCGGNPAGGRDVAVDSAGPVAESNRDALFDRFAAIHTGGMVDTLWTPESLAQSLPNQLVEYQYNYDDDVRTVTGSDAFVFGEVVAVKAGDGVRYSDESATESETVDYWDTSADGRFAIAEIRVSEAFGDPQVVPGSTVQLKFGSMGLPPEQLLDSLASLRPVAVAVVRDPIYPDLFMPGMSGALLGEVNEDGGFNFPGLGADSGRFQGGIDRIEDVRVAMRLNPEPILLGLLAKPGSTEK